MNRRTLLTLFAAQPLVQLPVRPSEAHGYKTKTIEISHPWTFEQENSKGADAIIGMEIKNKGKILDRLIRVETGDAERADIVRIEGTTAGQASGIDLLPGSSITLHAKGSHVLLRGVRKTLFAYNNLFITLVFAKAGKIKVEVVVEERPTEEPARS